MNRILFAKVTVKALLMWLGIFVGLYFIESTIVYFMDGTVWKQGLWVLPIYYLGMMILFVPVWWIIFIHIRKGSFWAIILAHLLLCPIFIQLWYWFNNRSLTLAHLNHYNPTDKIAILNFYYIGVLNYLLLFGLVHAYRFFLEREELSRREKELQSATHSHELSALKAQIHPHFLFNTLNTISASVAPSQEATREMIAWLADVFRYALKVANLSRIPIEEEVDFMIAVLQLEQKRFKERLSFSINMDPSVRHYEMAPLLIQPLLENAIKHGISPCIEGGKVEVNIGPKEGKLCVSVTNTGMTYMGNIEDVYHSSGIGLVNTRKRLELIYNSSLYIEKNNPSGLIVSFQLPLHQTG